MLLKKEVDTNSNIAKNAKRDLANQLKIKSKKSYKVEASSDDDQPMEEVSGKG